jgi:hypothetical protein
MSFSVKPEFAFSIHNQKKNDKIDFSTISKNAKKMLDERGKK